MAKMIIRVLSRCQHQDWLGCSRILALGEALRKLAWILYTIDSLGHNLSNRIIVAISLKVSPLVLHVFVEGIHTKVSPAQRRSLP